VPDIPALVTGEYRRLRASKVYVESGGTQKGTAQIIRRHQDPHMNVIEVPTSGQGDKLVRASALLSLAEASNLFLPADDPIFPRDAVEFELLAFDGTGAGHDDIWDSASISGRIAEGSIHRRGGLAPRLIQT